MGYSFTKGINDNSDIGNAMKEMAMLIEGVVSYSGAYIIDPFVRSAGLLSVKILLVL